MLSAFLLTSSLLLMVGMVSALMWLAALRARGNRTAVHVESDNERV